MYAEMSCADWASSKKTWLHSTGIKTLIIQEQTWIAVMGGGLGSSGGCGQHREGLAAVDNRRSGWSRAAGGAFSKHLPRKTGTGH